MSPYLRLPRLGLVLLLGAALTACATLPRSAPTVAKQLIEFGWDEPDTAFLRRHIAEMEASPFDGCVFRVAYSTPDGQPGNFTWEAWGRRPFTEAALQPALADLQATAASRFHHNFLRVNVTPGDVDWFDDFSAILHNARLAARLARQGGATGVLLDVEQYQAPLFEYRRQRDADTKSWDAYRAQVQERGRELMEAFQAGYPNLTLFLTFGYSVPWLETKGGTKELAECEYGLLVPLLDGMVEAAQGRARIVEGYEPAYYHNKDRSAFRAAHRQATEELLPIVADREKYRRIVSVGFGLWMDFAPAGHAWDGRDGSRNFYTPDEFEASVRAALEAADEYVWIYTETPRWWSNQGTPVNLPKTYDRALRRAHERSAP